MPPLKRSAFIALVAGIVVAFLVIAMGTAFLFSQLVSQDTSNGGRKTLGNRVKQFVPSTKGVSREPREFGVADILDQYVAGPDKATETVAFNQVATVNLNSLVGLPSDGNVLKVHTACINESNDRVYADGIVTNNIAVIEDGKTVAYFPTPFSKIGKNIKYIFCEDDFLILASSERIVSLDPDTGEVRANIRVEEVFPEKGFLDAESGLFFVGVPSSNTVNIYNAKTLALQRSLPSGRGIWTRAADGTFLLIEQSQTRGGGLIATWYDPTSFTVTKTSRLTGVVGAGEIAYDAEHDGLWIEGRGEISFLSFSATGLIDRTFAAPDDVKEIVVASGKVLVVSENGFDDGVEPGFKGGVVIANSSTGVVERTLEIPWKHTQINATNDGRAVLVNNDGNSVDLINLATGTYTVVDVGSASETLAVDGDGSIYIGNRLGGSTVPVVSSTFNLTAELDAGVWPVSTVYSPSLNRVFTYNMLASTIGVIDAATHTLVDTYDLGVADANTDALGEMAYDETHHVLFVVIPEQYTVVVVDAENGGVIETLSLLSSTVREKEIGGPGTFLVGVYEPTMTLYVYVKDAQELSAYDGLNGFAKIASKRVSVDALATYPSSMFVDQYHDRVFLGNTAFDVVTLEEVGTLPSGVQMVLGIDNERGVVFGAGVQSQQETLYAMNANLVGILDTAPLPKGEYVKTRGIFDAKSGRLYASEMTLAEVWVFEPYR